MSTSGHTAGHSALLPVPLEGEGEALPTPGRAGGSQTERPPLPQTKPKNHTKPATKSKTVQKPKSKPRGGSATARPLRRAKSLARGKGKRVPSSTRLVQRRLSSTPQESPVSDPKKLKRKETTKKSKKGKSKRPKKLNMSLEFSDVTPLVCKTPKTPVPDNRRVSLDPAEAAAQAARAEAAAEAEVAAWQAEAAVPGEGNGEVSGGEADAEPCRGGELRSPPVGRGPSPDELSHTPSSPSLSHTPVSDDALDRSKSVRWDNGESSAPWPHASPLYSPAEAQMDHKHLSSPESAMRQGEPNEVSVTPRRPMPTIAVEGVGRGDESLHLAQLAAVDPDRQRVSTASPDLHLVDWQAAEFRISQLHPHFGTLPLPAPNGEQGGRDAHGGEHKVCDWRVT